MGFSFIFSISLSTFLLLWRCLHFSTFYLSTTLLLFVDFCNIFSVLSDIMFLQYRKVLNIKCHRRRIKHVFYKIINNMVLIHSPAPPRFLYITNIFPEYISGVFQNMRNKNKIKLFSFFIFVFVLLLVLFFCYLCRICSLKNSILPILFKKIQWKAFSRIESLLYFLHAGVDKFSLWDFWFFF